VDTRDLRSVLAASPRLYNGRPDKIAKLMVRAPVSIKRHEVTSCEVSRLFADGLGLPQQVVDGLSASFERFDGHGNPGVLGGEEIPLGTRIAQAAQIAELISHDASPDQFAGRLHQLAGKVLDPEIAELLAADPSLLDGLDAVDAVAVLAAEPAPHVLITEESFDAAARAIGAVVDLKSPCLIGHSDRVARCAAGAAAAAGLPPAEVDLVRRAGWLHDIGRAAITSRIWDKPGPLTAAEWEQARRHPYFTRRVLGQVADWTELAQIAGAHHERLDGSGYPDAQHGSPSTAAAILAAADLYCTLTERRPHREPLGEPQAHAQLDAAVRTGQLDADAVAAVLDPAQSLRVRPGVPSAPFAAAELTAREREVLGLVARGLTNRAIGSRLGVSAKTVNTHLEHAFAKLGVSSRAAAVFALTR
jgi:HD-GYP domain-containing protein (c-di-GMP phosphodiesterase class II)/DNA-binding CsgD family transcriptional regulator